MHLTHKTIQNILALSKDERLEYVFKKMDNSESAAPQEVLRALANAFQEELGIRDDKIDTLVFLMSLAALAREEVDA